MRSGLGFECVPEAPPYNLPSPDSRQHSSLSEFWDKAVFRCQAHRAGPWHSPDGCTYNTVLADVTLKLALSRSARLPLLGAGSHCMSHFSFFATSRANAKTSPCTEVLGRAGVATNLGPPEPVVGTGPGCQGHSACNQPYGTGSK